jgi:protein Tex
VQVGQIVKVQVISTDAKTKRIALSMKSQQATPPAPPKPKPSVDDLATRWKMR